jgi:hypothetical protein
MKKNLYLGMIVILILFSMVACGQNPSTSTSTDDVTDMTVTETNNDQSSEESSLDTANVTETSDDEIGDQSTSESLSWPVEFEQWGVPIISTAKVTIADNRSSNGNTLTQGVNAIVNLENVTEDDFDNYCVALEEVGFVKSPDSLEKIIVLYSKSIDGGELLMTLSFDESVTTVIVNNSTAASQKEANAGGSTQWPDDAIDIPEFTKGSFLETVEMGGNMYAITFNDVTEVDLNWYRDELLSNGFEKQESEDTEGYMKMTTDTAYSVGFVLDGSTLQIIIAVGFY